MTAAIVLSGRMTATAIGQPRQDSEIVNPAELITSDAPTTTVCAVASVPYHSMLPPFAAVVTVSQTWMPEIVACVENGPNVTPCELMIEPWVAWSKNADCRA
jgi:hypothetical protein